MSRFETGRNRNRAGPVIPVTAVTGPVPADFFNPACATSDETGLKPAKGGPMPGMERLGSQFTRFCGPGRKIGFRLKLREVKRTFSFVERLQREGENVQSSTKDELNTIS